MKKRTTRIALALAALAALAGCGTVASTSTPPKAPASTSARAQVTDPGSSVCASVEADGFCPNDQPSAPADTSTPDDTPVDTTLACSTVIDDTGYKNGPLTEVRGIAILSAILTTAALDLNGGTLSDSVLTAMGGMALDMENYSGSQLADDAAQYASDEQEYAQPGPSGDANNTAFALPLEKDILQLVKDCPRAYALGQKMLNGG
jgi:hypothetical protein